MQSKEYRKVLEEEKKRERGRKREEKKERKYGENGGRRGGRRAEGSLYTSVISYSCSHTVPATPGQNLSDGECTYTSNCRYTFVLF